MNKRIISLCVVLALVFSTAASAVDSTMATAQENVDIDDPFALMYDSDIELEEVVTQIVDYSEFVPVKKLAPKASKLVTVENDSLVQSTDTEEITSAINLSTKDVTEIVMQSSLSGKMEELQKIPFEKAQIREIERAIANSGETRYIIKHKSGDFKSVSNYLSRNDAGVFSVSVMDTDETSELLVFEHAVNPQTLAKKLKANNFGNEIEYIQPDYKIGLATEEHFSLDVVSNVTSGDKGAKDDAVKAEPESPDVSVSGATEAPLPVHEAANSTDNGSDDISVLPKEDIDIPTEGDADEEGITEKIPSKIELNTPIETPELPIEPLIPDNELTDIPIIALIDSGVDITHPDISERIWEGENGINGWNFVDDSEQVFDSEQPELSSHGTHIAGIIAQNSQNTKIMVLKAFDREGAYTSDIIAAIRFAEEHGASVVNCSFDSNEYNKALEDVIAESNMLFITAAGNNRDDLAEKPVYPACFNLANIICVTSVNADGGLSYFSNYSPSVVDIAAIGRDVESCLPENESGKMSGTSMSAAQVTGTAAAVLETAPTLTTEELSDRLLESAQPLSNLTNVIAAGRMIDVESAIADQTQQLVKQNSPEEDFDISGYQDKSASFRLYSSSGKIFKFRLRIMQLLSSKMMVLFGHGAMTETEFAETC